MPVLHKLMKKASGLAEPLALKGENQYFRLFASDGNVK